MANWALKGRDTALKFLKNSTWSWSVSRYPAIGRRGYGCFCCWGCPWRCGGGSGSGVVVVEYVRTVVHRAAEGINWPAKAVSRSVHPARIGIYTHPLVSELFAGSLLIVVCSRRGRRGLVGVSCVVSSWRFFCSAEGFARHGYHSQDQTSITCNMIFHFLLHKVQITSPVLYGEKNESQKSKVKKRSGKKSEKKKK